MVLFINNFMANCNNNYTENVCLTYLLLSNMVWINCCKSGPPKSNALNLKQTIGTNTSKQKEQKHYVVPLSTVSIQVPKHHTTIIPQKTAIDISEKTLNENRDTLHNIAPLNHHDPLLDNPPSSLNPCSQLFVQNIQQDINSSINLKNTPPLGQQNKLCTTIDNAAIDQEIINLHALLTSTNAHQALLSDTQQDNPPQQCLSNPFLDILNIFPYKLNHLDPDNIEDQINKLTKLEENLDTLFSTIDQDLKPIINFLDQNTQIDNNLENIENDLPNQDETANSINNPQKPTIPKDGS